MKLNYFPNFKLSLLGRIKKKKKGIQSKKFDSCSKEESDSNAYFLNF